MEMLCYTTKPQAIRKVWLYLFACSLNPFFHDLHDSFPKHQTFHVVIYGLINRYYIGYFIVHAYYLYYYILEYI